MVESVLGLDLSLRATGIAVVPVRWGLKWPRVQTFVVGDALSKEATERDRYLRIDGIVMQVLDQVQRHRCKAVAIEQYAFSRSDSHSHELGELGGCVKRALFVNGIDVHVYHANSSRKLLGKAPQKDPKGWAKERLVATGAPDTWEPDQYDAFLAANHLLSLIGGHALVLPAEAA